MFGREKVQTGDEHRVLSDVNPEPMDEPTRMGIIHEEVAQNSGGSFETNKKRYNSRSRVRKFTVGTQVQVTNKVLSSAADKRAAKLAPLRKVAYIGKILGDDTYELIDSQQKVIGNYHANDLAIR